LHFDVERASPKGVKYCVPEIPRSACGHAQAEVKVEVEIGREEEVIGFPS
jgi:hypothetical protein